jgi:hypothetical protein
MRTQDGMDWLGGGDTTVANSFSRAADDDFALEGNWDGYRPAGVAIVRIEVVNADVLRWDRRVRRARTGSEGEDDDEADRVAAGEDDRVECAPVPPPVPTSELLPWVSCRSDVTQQDRMVGDRCLGRQR